jgi:hypothetical protein
MNIIKSVSFLFICSMAIVSCTLPAAEHTQEFQPVKTVSLETLYGFNVTESFIIFTVISTGCTKEKDFQLQTSATPDGYDVSILRGKPDRCRRAPMYQEIKIPLDHTRKNDHFRILNSIKMKS